MRLSRNIKESPVTRQVSKDALDDLFFKAKTQILVLQNTITSEFLAVWIRSGNNKIAKGVLQSNTRTDSDISQLTAKAELLRKWPQFDERILLKDAANFGAVWKNLPRHLNRSIMKYESC